jgi:hypothetical protein
MPKLTKEQEKRFNKKIYEELLRYGWSSFRFLVQQHLADELAKERKKVLDKLLEKGHGGGNWRRLITQLKNE